MGTCTNVSTLCRWTSTFETQTTFEARIVGFFIFIVNISKSCSSIIKINIKAYQTRICLLIDFLLGLTGTKSFNTWFYSNHHVYQRGWFGRWHQKGGDDQLPVLKQVSIKLSFLENFGKKFLIWMQWKWPFWSFGMCI